MAVLWEGCQYGLSSQQNLSDNKSYFFVKLTDSAIKAIEDHVKSGGRSTISFDGNDGTIAFENECRFQFSVSVNPDPGGSFECLRQRDGSGLELEALGSMLHKVRVQANDDVYETTRQRVATVEQASKQNRTRVIKQSDPFIGRRGVKVKAPVRSRPAQRSASPPAPAPAPAPAQQRAAAPGRRPAAPARGRPGPLASTENSGPAPADLIRRPIRERLAHLLAVRPCKKIEVMQKLYNEGIREKDKKNVPGLLASVATLRDNVYHLKRHVWPEVSVDWPFYSEQQRRQVAANRPGSGTPPGAADSSGSNGRSPAGKRRSPSAADPAPPADHCTAASTAACTASGGPKKARVSRVPCVDGGAPAAADCDSSVSSGGGDAPSNRYQWHGGQSRSPSSTGVSERTPTPDSSPDSHNSDSSCRAGEPDAQPDYLSQYGPITCESQLQRYRGDFEAGYQEYQLLWKTVGGVYRKFAELEQQLRAAPEGSEQWKGIERRIRDEYEACNNERYRAARRRWLYLQNKLQYVKSLVRQWQADR